MKTAVENKKCFSFALVMGAVIIAAVCVSALTGCGGKAFQEGTSYQKVSAEEAKTIMDTHSGYVILDVRAQSEYDEGHVPGAIVIPHTDIKEKAEGILTDKNQEILVYCRSGNRSKKAAEALVSLGYTNIIEFGGINSWPYDIEK